MGRFKTVSAAVFVLFLFIGIQKVSSYPVGDRDEAGFFKKAFNWAEEEVDEIEHDVSELEYSLEDDVEGGFHKVEETVDDLINGIRAGEEYVRTKKDMFLKGARDAWNSTVVAIQETFDEEVQNAEEAATAVKVDVITVVATVEDAVRKEADAVESEWEGFKNGLTRSWNAFCNGASNLWKDTKSFFGTVADSVGDLYHIILWFIELCFLVVLVHFARAAPSVKRKFNRFYSHFATELQQGQHKKEENPIESSPTATATTAL